MVTIGPIDIISTVMMAECEYMKHNDKNDDEKETSLGTLYKGTEKCDVITSPAMI